MRRTLLAFAAVAVALLGCEPSARPPRPCDYFCGQCHYYRDAGAGRDPVGWCILQADGTCHYPPPWPDCERDGGV